MILLHLTVKTGMLVGEMLNVPTSLVDCHLLIGDEKWTDYTLECKVKVSVEKPGEKGPLAPLGPLNTVGLIFRFKGASDFYSFYSLVLSFGLDKDGRVVGPVMHIKVTAKEEIDKRGRSREWFGPMEGGFVFDNRWYKLKVTAKGNHFKFFLDDSLVGEVDDTVHSAGGVGLYISPEFGLMKVYFDDFAVSGPDIPDGGSGWAVKSKGKIVMTWGQIRSRR